MCLIYIKLNTYKSKIIFQKNVKLPKSNPKNTYNNTIYVTKP